MKFRSGLLQADSGLILSCRKLTHGRALNCGKQGVGNQRNRSNYCNLFTGKVSIENLEAPVPQGISSVALVSTSHWMGSMPMERAALMELSS